MITLQVGVKAFLKNKEGKFLLLKRSAEKYGKLGNIWDLVGGRIEAETSLIENLIREVKEETNLEILSTPRLLYAQDVFFNTNIHVVRLTYLAMTEGEPVLDTSENIEYKWLSKEEIAQHEDLDIYVKEILEKGLLK